MNEFRKFIYSTLIAFVLILVVWFGIIFLSACGLNLSCQQAKPIAARTPIPTLAAATLPAIDFSISHPTTARCRIATVDLIGAWVSSGYSDSDVFTFTDVEGTSCQANFADDVQPLFIESNLWYPGSLSCASCHQPDLTTASAQLDLSSYAGMLLGSRRETPEDPGDDIFGAGVWENSLLYDNLFVKRIMPLGRPPDVPAEGPIVFAGVAVEPEIPPTETSTE
ncbi:MAG: hypothetical protein QGD88_00390 [Anaerolineae bacterium]|nr:hypothetical protein [Anaerolineae bacterium]